MNLLSSSMPKAHGVLPLDAIGYIPTKRFGYVLAYNLDQYEPPFLMFRGYMQKYIFQKFLSATIYNY